MLIQSEIFLENSTGENKSWCIKISIESCLSSYIEIYVGTSEIEIG